METATPVLSHLAQAAAIPAGGLEALATYIGAAVLTVIVFAFFVKVLRDPHYGERD